MNWYKRLFFISALLSLYACGGGGDAPNTAAPSPTQATNTAPVIDSFSTTSSNENGEVSLTWRVSDPDQDDLSCTITISGGLSLSHSVPNCIVTTEYRFSVPANGRYTAEFSVSDGLLSNGTSDSIEVSSIVESADVMTIKFLHSAENYDIWGLHLWGDAIAPSDQTTWQQPRPLTRIENDYAVFEVPIADATQYFNFIVHFGDIKSPPYDLRLIPESFGTSAWVVQDTAVNITGINAEPFADEASARAAFETLKASIGNASEQLDLSPVEPQVPQNALADNWQDNANFMEIYVRAYKDSDSDGIGDINGLIEQLDYLHDLGITGLWLMPIMESSDNDHGYETQDYRAIESDYGSMQDFERLLDEAHARGIAIVIDYLVNHASYLNPVFVDAASGSDHPKRDWFIWRDSPPSNWSLFGGDPWRSGISGHFYGAFTSRMPDFNLLNPEVIAFHQSNLAFWLNKGVDGFRFDAVGVLVENGAGRLEDQPENHGVMRAMRDIITQYPKSYMVCEAPTGFARFAQSDSCGKAFHFNAGHQILDSVKSGRVTASLIDIVNDHNLANMPLILANHDFFAGNRIANQLNNNLNQYRLAAASYVLLSANPFTYYGEEIGMAAGENMQNDASLRTPMSWTNNRVNAGFSTSATIFRGLSANVTDANVEQQLADDRSLYYFYKRIYDLRDAYPSIALGNKTALSQANQSVLAWRSEHVSESGTEEVIVLINFANNAVTQSYEMNQAQRQYTQILGDAGTGNSAISDDAANLTLSIGAFDIQVWLASP